MKERGKSLHLKTFEMHFNADEGFHPFGFPLSSKMKQREKDHFSKMHFNVEKGFSSLDFPLSSKMKERGKSLHLKTFEMHFIADEDFHPLTFRFL